MYGIIKSNSNSKCENIFACLFNDHNTISLSRQEQVCLIRLRFERYFSHPLWWEKHLSHGDGRSISRSADDGRGISGSVVIRNVFAGFD